jgi:hypothetical protein
MTIPNSIKSLPILHQGYSVTHNKHVLYVEDEEITAVDFPEFTRQLLPLKSTPLRA